MEVVVAIIIGILVISAIIGIIQGVLHFLENDFIPFFADIGAIIIAVALGAIAIAITIAIISFIVIFFRSKIIPRLRRYRVVREIKETDAAIEDLLKKPLPTSEKINFEKIKSERLAEIDLLMKKKEAIADAHIRGLKKVYEDLIKEGKD